MPLKLIKRPGRNDWYVFGTHLGQFFRRSTKTADRAEAEIILAKYQAENFNRRILGPQTVTTFLEAAISFLRAGKGGKNPRFLNRLLYKDAELTVLTELASMVLSDINQRTLDKLVEQCPGAANGT